MNAEVKKLLALLAIGVPLAVASAVALVWRGPAAKQSLEVRYEHDILSRDIYETCLKIRPNERLKYSFQSSAPLEFNIHYHIEPDDEVIYPVHEPLISYRSASFIPDITQIYCLMWENRNPTPVGLSFQSRVLPGFAADENATAVTFRADNAGNRIIAIDDGGSEALSIPVDSTILNFAISHAGNRLAVLTSGDNLLKVYDLETRHWTFQKSFPSAPRFLVFSDDDGRLALADEHNAEVVFLDTKRFEEIERLVLPAPPVALSNSEKPDQLLVRTGAEIIEVDFVETTILQTDAKIPIEFGGEQVLIDPQQWCFSHGIPHPLYSDAGQAMTVGLGGVISSRKSN